MKKRLTGLLLLALASGCKKNETIDSNPPVIAGCRLSSIDRGATDKHTYTYDSQGRITTMTRTTANNLGAAQQFVYSFTYDANGKLTSSSWTLDGKADGTARYSYDSGRITTVNSTYADGKTSVGNLRYFVNNRISEFILTSTRENATGRRYYEYDASGILVKTGFSDLKGNKFYEVVTKPTGQVKVPDQLLVQNGLPFDVLTGAPWQETIGGVGTTAQTYFSDSKTGQLVLAYTGTTTAVQTGAKEFLTDFTLTDQDKKIYTQKYTLTNCQ